MKKKHSKQRNKKQKKQLLKQYGLIGTDKVTFICLSCHEEEEIPREVVEFLDGMDVEEDPFSPPQFSCTQCEGEMYPAYYKNEFGCEFQISDVR